ncbi:MAG: B3/4 domain-containing protein [Promethearchaeota archaeon]
MEISYHQEIREIFPDLKISLLAVKDLKIEKEAPHLEGFKEVIIQEIKLSYFLETLKDNETFRKYRDFFWKIDIDPTKIRPASEALIRRILQGKPLPKINTGVDAYNLASIKSGIPLAAFDMDKITGNLTMRFSKDGEEFTGIGMKKPKILTGKEIVVADVRRLIAIYPYRDADFSKIMPFTENILVMSCGVPGIAWETVQAAGQLAKEYLERFCRD